jgi:hypothetical protein
MQERAAASRGCLTMLRMAFGGCRMPATHHNATPPRVRDPIHTRQRSASSTRASGALHPHAPACATPSVCCARVRGARPFSPWRSQRTYTRQRGAPSTRASACKPRVAICAAVGAPTSSAARANSHREPTPTAANSAAPTNSAARPSWPRLHRGGQPDQPPYPPDVSKHCLSQLIFRQAHSAWHVDEVGPRKFTGTCDQCSVGQLLLNFQKFSRLMSSQLYWLRPRGDLGTYPGQLRGDQNDHLDHHLSHLRHSS